MLWDVNYTIFKCISFIQMESNLLNNCTFTDTEKTNNIYKSWIKNISYNLTYFLLSSYQWKIWFIIFKSIFLSTIIILIFNKHTLIRNTNCITFAFSQILSDFIIKLLLTFTISIWIKFIFFFYQTIFKSFMAYFLVWMSS